MRTDHNFLTWLTRFRNIQGQLARWLEELSQYDMVLTYRPGKQHTNADALSRMPQSEQPCYEYRPGRSLKSLPCFREGQECKHCRRVHEHWSRFEEDVDNVVPLAVKPVSSLRVASPSTCEVSGRSLTEDIRSHLVDLHFDIDSTAAEICVRQVGVNAGGEQWVPGYAVEDLVARQEADPDLSMLHEWLAKGDVSSADLHLASPAVKKLWQFRRQIDIREGLLYYVWEDPHSTPPPIFLVPRSMISEVLALCHDSVTGSHSGIVKTYDRLRRRFMWHGMYHDCRLYVETCITCQLQKKPSRKMRAAMQLHHAGAPLERVHLDMLGPFPPSRNGNVYILVLVDQFSKWVECYPTSDQTAQTVARVVVDEFISRFGCPLEIFTDQGRNFDSDLFRTLCSILDIKKVRTTPYMPASNGQVERYNRQICQMIRCFLQGRDDAWDEHLPRLAGAIRATPHRQTGFTPNMLMLGREALTPIELTFRPCVVDSPQLSEAEYLTNLRSRLLDAHEITREHLQATQAYEKKRYDLFLHSSTFQPGDIVFRLNLAPKLQQSSKLKPPFEGPYVITEVISPVLVRIKNRKREFVVHHNNVVPRVLRDTPLWVTRILGKLGGGDPDDQTDTEPEFDTDSETDYGMDRLFLEPEAVLLAGNTATTRGDEFPSAPQFDPQSVDKIDSGVFPSAAPAPLDPPLIDPAPQVTRAGRKTKTPAHLLNYF